MHDPGAISKRLMTSAAFCCPICASIARASSHCWPRSQQLIAALHTTSHEAVLSEEGSVQHLMRLQGLCRVCQDLIFLRAGSGEKSQRHDGNSGFRLPNRLLPLGTVNLGSSCGKFLVRSCPITKATVHHQEMPRIPWSKVRLQPSCCTS